MKILVSFLTAVLFFSSCRQHKADPAILTDANILHRNMDELTSVIIHDAFAPPNASRIYAYASIASYEALRFAQPGYASVAARLHGFAPMPVPQKGQTYNYLLAASNAFFTVAENVTFSKDSLINYKTALLRDFEPLLDKETFERSLDLGQQVAASVLARTKMDRYQETRGMTKFLGTTERGKWRPTPPDYNDASEPHWADIQPLMLDSAGQISCPAPPPFDLAKGSPFRQSVDEVYAITQQLTDEQKEIARYWDDNPFVVEHAGHLMFANKKITPVGHWIGITDIACRHTGAGAADAARAYALTSTAIFDAIITCWKTKYQYQHIRPITVINESIDPAWQPLLQTPSFPEHSSGHSAISAAASVVLTKLFGSFPFEDTSDLAYIGMKRSFSSFTAAAQEASISRVYGGIHYRTGIDAGAIQGRKIGAYAISKLGNEQPMATAEQAVSR